MFIQLVFLLEFLLVTLVVGLLDHVSCTLMSLMNE